MKLLQTITLSLLLCISCFCQGIIASQETIQDEISTLAKNADHLEIPETLKLFFQKYHNNPEEKPYTERCLAVLLTLLHIDSSVDIEEKLNSKLDADKKELENIQADHGWMAVFPSEQAKKKTSEEKTKIVAETTICLKNQEKIRKIIALHKTYLQGKKVFNFYKNMPEDVHAMSDWIKNDLLGQENLPFKKYKTVALDHLKFIDNFVSDKDKYPELAAMLEQARSRITNSLTLMDQKLQEETREQEEKEQLKKEEEKARLQQEEDHKEQIRKTEFDEKERLKKLAQNQIIADAAKSKAESEAQKVKQDEAFQKKMIAQVEMLNTVDFRQLETIGDKKLNEILKKIDDQEATLKQSDIKISELQPTLKKMKAITEIYKNYTKLKDKKDELDKKIKTKDTSIEELTFKINLEMSSQKHAKHTPETADIAKRECDNLIRVAKQQEDELSKLRKDLEKVAADIGKVKTEYEEHVSFIDSLKKRIGRE